MLYEQISTPLLAFIVLAVLWQLPWKGYALWKSARKGHKIWFIVLLVVNTMAILEILYIFVFSEGCCRKPEKKAKRR